VILDLLTALIDSHIAIIFRPNSPDAKTRSSLPQCSLRELLFSIVASGVSGVRLSPSLVLLDFREITAGLVHRGISSRHNARRPPGLLADFQGGPSRTGGNVAAFWGQKFSTVCIDSFILKIGS
jgi:hypothetical protein